MNQLVMHQGVKGTENELSLARILERLVPARYSVGTGMLIDRHGSYSKQMDIVIYESAEEPAILAQTNQVLFPVENVRLCIEVKTTVTRREIDDARAKKESIEALDSTTDWPDLALLAYKSSIEAHIIKQALNESRTDTGPRPDFACIINMGIVGFTHNDVWQTGLTALREVDKNGNPIPGTVQRPTDTETDAKVIRSNSAYPIVRLERDLVAEPSRALLLFCENVLVSLRRNATPLVLSSYMDATTREILEL
jgi:hypothetical protein